MDAGELWMERQKRDAAKRICDVATTGKQQANPVEAVGRKRKGNDKAEIPLEKRACSGFFDNVRVCNFKQDVSRDEGFARRWVPSVQNVHDDPSATCWWDGDGGSTKVSGSSDFSMDEIRSGFFDNVRGCILKQVVGGEEEFSRHWVPSVQHVHDDPSATCWWDGDDGSTKSSGRQHSSDFSMVETQLEKRPSSGFFDNLRVCIVKQDVGRDEEFASDFCMDEIQLEKRPSSGFFDFVWVCILKRDVGRDEGFDRRWVLSDQQEPSATCWWDEDDRSTKFSGRQHFSDVSMDEIQLEKRPSSGLFNNARACILKQDVDRDEGFDRCWVPSVQREPSASCWWDDDDGSTKFSGRQHSSDVSVDEMRLAISKSMEDMERTQEKMRETLHEVTIAKRKVDRLWEDIEAATPLRRAHYRALVEAERAQAEAC